MSTKNYNTYQNPTLDSRDLKKKIKMKEVNSSRINVKKINLYIIILTGISGISGFISLKKATTGPLYLSSELLPGVCNIPCTWGTATNNLLFFQRQYYRFGYATITLQTSKLCQKKYYRCETN